MISPKHEEVCMKPIHLPESHRDLLDGNFCAALTTIPISSGEDPYGQPSCRLSIVVI
jgi:hypothetical protein